jgi:hypothetical protein
MLWLSMAAFWAKAPVTFLAYPLAEANGNGVKIDLLSLIYQHVLR